MTTKKNILKNNFLKSREKIDLQLERIYFFLNCIGSPQNKFKSVLITGTNGKGSTTFYLSNLACKNTKLKIGRYTSPHLISWEERFRINEKPVNKKKLNNAYKYISKKAKAFEKEYKQYGELTEFEIYTAVAFKLFEAEKVNLAFLEIGLGGRLDATNVVNDSNVLASIITNVSYDHMDFLGNSIKKIAYEKAGVIKKNVEVITSAKGEALKVIRQKAKKTNSKVILVKHSKNYIENNINTALEAWKIIAKKLKIKINTKKENKYLKLISLPGRFQWIKEKKILLDGAHNPHAALKLKELINLNFKNKKIIYIIGILDKDYKNFIKNLIPKNSYVICTEPKSIRKTKKEFLKNAVLKNGSIAEAKRNLNLAIQKAYKLNPDLILITGSLYLIGEALRLLSHNTDSEFTQMMKKTQ